MALARTVILSPRITVSNLFVCTLSWASFFTSLDFLRGSILFYAKSNRIGFVLIISLSFPPALSTRAAATLHSFLTLPGARSLICFVKRANPITSYYDLPHLYMPFAPLSHRATNLRVSISTLSRSYRMPSIASLRRITAKSLSDMILAESSASETTFAIIDVRDDGMCSKWPS